MGNVTSWYQFISQEIGTCQALLSPKGKTQHIAVRSHKQKFKGAIDRNREKVHITPGILEKFGLSNSAQIVELCNLK